MSEQPKQIDFEEWVRILFDRPAGQARAEQWEIEREAPAWDLPDIRHIEFATRLFLNAQDTLSSLDSRHPSAV